MRKRTKMSGLVSHTTPEYSRMSEESKLLKKFECGNITKEELKKLASFMVVRKKTTVVKNVEVVELKVKYVEKPQYYIKCWDKWIPCTETQYNMAPKCVRKVEMVKVKSIFDI